MSWAQGNEEPHKAAVRASIIARKRVTTVERRDAGKWMRDEPAQRKPTGVSGGSA